ncbi:protein FAR1-RELATED SEQUENCE 5-like isoform X5 [Phoenix dactylifera]|uniref:Protein FAR1-RELATED SEQUENCE 5-like isoform X5 n=1 Tax=Phoenix dactylifera TaxID=42345 RepID=A0A8B9A7D9_PHODC|nr:protein FAR1-RELATED SEQUENCE 5-like isoform X5 [Phoenix dactylifera]
MCHRIIRSFGLSILYFHLLSWRQDNESVETVEDSLSDKEKDDAEMDNMSQGPSTGENVVQKISQASKEGDSGSAVVKYTNNIDKSKANGNSQLEPEVGMVFHSEDQAYLFYNRYAHRKGFSVRKGHLGRRKDGTVRNRVFLCSNEGSRQEHSTHMTKKPREAVRTNCMARIEYKVSRDNVWVVSKIIYEHNHPLLRPHKAHLLRSHRKLLLAQRDGMPNVAEMGNDADNPAQALEFLVEEARDAETVGFLLKDQSSYLHTNRMRELEKGDAQVLLEFLKAKQLEDPSFFYAIQLDDREQVTNFFWADARSILDFSYFGDVVLFDTTYRTNKVEIPFAPFIGINHHKQIVVFGAALLLDETTESFVWLFKTFMVAMSGRQPKTIFTDHFPALSRAISLTLPETCHRLCLWHILQNSAIHISHAYSSEPDFQKGFKNCIYEGGSEEDFHTRWVDLVNKYGLEGNAWLEDLYAIREKWALVYHKNSFCASMTTVKWSESMKNHFKKHFNRKLPLSKFLEQYQKSLVRFHEKELYEDYKSRQTKPVLLVDMPMLNEAAESYTRLVYNEFEDEIKSQLSCLCEQVGFDGTVDVYKVSLPEKHSYGIVEYNSSNFMVTCSCKKFETAGILCMHALKILLLRSILSLPTRYILKRWTKYANVEAMSDRHRSIADTDGQEPLTLQYTRVCHKAITIGVKSAVSEDALQIFENELDKLMSEVENVLRIAPLSRQTDEEDVTVVDDMQRNALEGSKKRRGCKGRPKGGLEQKRNKKIQPTSSSVDIITQNQQSQNKTKTIGQADVLGQTMVNESSNVPSYPPDGTTSCCTPIQMQPSGCTSFTQEVVMPAQESFTPSQGIFDHTMATQAVRNPSIAWCTRRGSVGVPMPIMQGQSNNFVSWMVQPRSVPNVSLSPHHLDEPMHSALPGQHQPSSRKLNFDINKGFDLDRDRVDMGLT